MLRSFQEAVDALWGFREALVRCAESQGVSVAGVGTPFDNPAEANVTDDSRYAAISDSVGEPAFEHHINGLHIHVGVPDRNAAIGELNYLRRWLPVLLAMSSNSPFWCGQDNRFSSWRTIQYRRWTPAGCPPTFIDAAGYDRRTKALIGTGVTADKGSISWSARLSCHQPTVGIRVADASWSPPRRCCWLCWGGHWSPPPWAGLRLWPWCRVLNC